MAFSFFTKKKEKTLGVDIGTSSVKIVELGKGKGGKIELTNYGELTVGVEETVQSSSVRISSQKAADIIKKVIAETLIVETKAAMSIPVFSGFSTVISLPKMSDAELEQAVTYEAKKYIPLPLQDVQFEWIRLPNPSEILLVAVTNELVNKYHQIAKLSGLVLSHLELDTFSLARSLGGSLIIDIGSRNTTLIVIENGWPVFSRTVDVSGYEITRLLSSSLSIDFKSAEDLKKERGIDAGADVILPLLDSIFMEARKVIEEYSRKKQSSVQRIVLSGGSAQMSGLVGYAAKSIGREVAKAFPFNDIIYPKELEVTLRDIGPSFAVAVGLALRGFM